MWDKYDIFLTRRSESTVFISLKVVIPRKYYLVIDLYADLYEYLDL